MRKQQAGFTFIELVMVIVILGILAATALPRFTDFSGQANVAAAQGLAGAVNAANAVNVSVCAMHHANCVTVTAPAAGDDAACVTAARAITQGFQQGSLTITSSGAGTCLVDGDGDPATTGDQATYTIATAP